MNTTIYLGADHAGWDLKEEVKAYLEEKGVPVVDMGNQNRVEGDDYPDFGHAVAKRVATEDGAHGILFCGNAQGICIVANKVKGVRAVTGFDIEETKTTRTDDNSNILCIPGRFVKKAEAKKIVDAWLETPFSGAERHVRRLEKLEGVEREEFGV